MTFKLNELIQTAISSRYKTGPWGHVPFPKYVPKVGQRDLPETATTCRYSPIYERVYRHRQNSAPLAWPMGRHSMIEIEEHFYKVLGDDWRMKLLVKQVDVFIRAWQHNIRNVGEKLVPGARAFLELWEIVETQNQHDCPKCKINLERKGRVPTKKLQSTMI